MFFLCGFIESNDVTQVIISLLTDYLNVYSLFCNEARPVTVGSVALSYQLR